MRAISARSWLFSALSALLLVLPFPLAGPVPPWRRALCWIALAPLFHALRLPDRSGRPLRVKDGAIVGYLCGVLWFLGNCYWVYQTMHLYGGIPEVGSAGILLLFSLYLGLYFALFGALFTFLQTRLKPAVLLLLAPFLWVAVELARTRITGFPWDLLGYTLTDNMLLTRLAPLTGVMGLSFVVAAVNALWLWLPSGKGRRLWGPVFACMLAVLFTIAGTRLPDGASAMAVPPAHTAVLLQDNLSVGAERVAEAPESRERMYASFQELSLHPWAAAAPGSLVSEVPARETTPPELILWPEAPTEFVSSDPGFRAQVGGLALQSHAAVIADSVTNRDEDGRPGNHVSASFFTPDGRFAGHYDKMHLVPFGEYVPFHQLFFFAGHLLDGLDFIPGRTRTLFETGGHRYGVFICYESVFGDEVREFVKNGAEVLVNLSDDGWYGDTSAPWEHLDMARMRAMENHRWLLRDTNTGLTGAISPDGVVHEALPRHIRAAQRVHFNYLHGTTVYTRFGDWIGWLCALVVVSASVTALAGRAKAVN